MRVFDYRTDVRNIVALPEIRGRFLRMQPGEVAGRHSHDLGHEIFLVLEGQCEFEIAGERAVLGPGQACFAQRDEMHQVRVVGDQPMTMYLSVTPHIDPTHTSWTADPKEGGQKLPPRYGGWRSRALDGIADPAAPIPALVDQHLDALRALVQVATAGAFRQAQQGGILRQAAENGDLEALRAALNALWEQMYPLLRATSALSEAWNDLALKASTELSKDSR